MFFYVLIIPVIIASAYMILRLRGIEKHDKVLYRFCQVRREAMSLIREHNFGLTREDYIALKEIEEITSATIHDYNICKIYVFNFRRFIAAIRRIENLERKLNQGQALKAEVKALRNRFGDAMVYAFITFTPFFKSERVLRLTQHAFAALAQVGGKYFKEKARRLAEIGTWMEREKQTPTFS